MSLASEIREQSRLDRLGTRLRYDLRDLVTRHPRLYMPLARWRRPASTVSPETDIVIEGYPRSGNTFAVTAFRLAQDHPVQTADRLHAPSHVLEAVSLGVPTLVLLRRPDDAVTSWWIRLRGAIDLNRLFLHYAHFYETVEPLRDRYVLATFDDVVTDFGRVIRRVNEFFGTDFLLFTHTPENVEACFQRIEAHNRQNNEGQVAEAGVGRPSGERQATRALLKREELAQAPSGWRRRAHDAWEHLHG